MRELTHLDEQGNARMVSVNDKEVTERRARASGRVSMSRECFEAVAAQRVKKGDVLATARVAGIMAAKRTADLIPLCHPLFLTGVSVDFELDEEALAVTAVCAVQCAERTGAEMEALTGASVALLTVYDMCKALDRAMEISEIHVDYKSGGRSGVYSRPGSEEP